MQANKNLVRVLNEQHVLQQAFNYGPISRSQISKNLQLNKVTVSDIVANLLDKTYLLELGQGVSTKNGGRKPTILQFNAHLGYVVNFDLGYDYIDRMINLLDGSIVAVERYEARDMEIEDRLALMLTLVHTKQLAAKIPLLGVGIAIHGIVKQNQVIYSPFNDFKGLDIAAILKDKLDVPILLQNEANLSVIYERDFESHDMIDNIVCISIHKGIGAGIILNNKLYTGEQGEAGEIGHTIVYDEQFLAHRKPTTIESICSEDAIIDTIRNVTGDANLKRADIIERYQGEDPDIVPIIDDFCFYTANIIYNIIVSFDPKRVVLNSGLIAAFPELLQRIKSYIPHLTNDETQVYSINDVKNCTLLGACSTIIHHVLKIESGQLIFG